MQYNESLIAMVGRVVRARPHLDKSLARDFLNERMRSILDRRPIWAGLLKRGIISIPNAYIAGTITVTTASPVVAGASTSWPVSDAVNTTFAEAVRPGQSWVTPASLSGITLDTVLYVDSAGTPEICPVLNINSGRILLNFTSSHNSGSTITASSLNGLQMQVGGYTSPPFTVIAVTSPTSLTLDNSWGAATAAGASYTIIKIFTTIDPNIKDLLNAWDPFQQIALRINVSQNELNMYDPNRTNTNSPTTLASAFPNICGNQQFEIYPKQITPYQLAVQYHVQWPDMKAPGDFPPPFINPNVLIYGALADAFITPCPRPPDNTDPGLNPDASDRYERRFQDAVTDLVNADESKYQQAFTWDYARTWGGASMGANWNQSHDIDAAMGNF